MKISGKSGLETSGCSVQLQSLISLGIVRREVPVTEKETSRRSIYRLEDSMFRFWYRFVRPNRGSISMGLGNVVYDQIVKPQIPDYMGKVFEEICRQYLFEPQVYTSFPFLYGKIGRWWGTDPRTHSQEEVDLIAVGDDAAVICECKWRSEKTPVSDAGTLLHRGELFPYSRKAWCIFSKSGFEEETTVFANEHNIRLVSFEEMV